MSDYTRSFKNYKTKFVYDLFIYADEQDRTVAHPDEFIETVIQKSNYALFLTDIAPTEIEGIHIGSVIKSDEANSFEPYENAYFLRGDLKFLKYEQLHYHGDPIGYIEPSKAFKTKQDCRANFESLLKSGSELSSNSTARLIETPVKNPMNRTSSGAASFTFDKARTIKNAEISFKVGYAILRQQNLPDNLLAALYELNSLRKKYRRMKPEKLKQIVAAKHGITASQLGSALQSRVNFMRHAQEAFKKIWKSE